MMRLVLCLSCACDIDAKTWKRHLRRVHGFTKQEIAVETAWYQSDS